MFCLADITLYADPYGTDKRTDETSTRALEQMPVHADQLSPLVKSSGNCLPSSSNYSCSAVYQVTSLFCCKNRILRTSAADKLKLTKGSSHAENASQEGAKGPGAPLHGGHRLHRDPSDLFGMAEAQPREHQHRPHLQVQR